MTCPDLKTGFQLFLPHDMSILEGNDIFRHDMFAFFEISSGEFIRIYPAA